MKFVKYTGPSDVREFNAEDMKKAGVEGFRKTGFPKGVSVAVEDEVADVLTSAEGFFSEEGFLLVSEEELEEDEDNSV